MLTGWISLQSKALSRVFFNTTVQKHQCLGTQLSLFQLSHPYMTTGKTIPLTGQTFVGKVMSLLHNVLSRLVIAFLPRSKHLVSFMAAVTVVILEPKKICQSFFFPICHGFPAAAAAKSLQPTRLPRPWDSPGKNTGEWVAISFSNA